MNFDFNFYILLVTCFLPIYVDGIICYKCHSAQPGCGKQLNIRLQKWHTCPDVPDGSGENFCVKVHETRNGVDYILRECLLTLRQDTYYREKLPTVQRQNYCQLGRNNDPWNPYDKQLKFCFCNDQFGCNTASAVKRPMTVALLLSLITFSVRYSLLV